MNAWTCEILVGEQDAEGFRSLVFETVMAVDILGAIAEAKAEHSDGEIISVYCQEVK